MAVVSSFESPAQEYAALNSLNLHNLIVGAHQHSIFFTKIEGNGLNRVGLFHGDILVAERAYGKLNNGDIVMAAVDGEFVIREYRDSCLYADNTKPIHCNETVVIEAVIKCSIRCFRKLIA